MGLGSSQRRDLCLLASRGLRVESPPAHTSHRPPTITPSRLMSSYHHEHDQYCCLLSCCFLRCRWLGHPQNLSSRTERSKAGDRTWPTSCSRALEARLMSISNLTSTRRPVDGSGNEARPLLPPTRDRDKRFPRYWTTLQPIRRRADESCKQTGRHHSNDPFHPSPPRQPPSRCRKLERKGDGYSEGVLSRTMSFELLHFQFHLPLYIPQNINSGLLI